MQLNRALTGLSDPKLQVHGSTFHMSQPTVWKMTAYTKHRKVAWIERKLKCGRHYIQRGGRGGCCPLLHPPLFSAVSEMTHVLQSLLLCRVYFIFSFDKIIFIGATRASSQAAGIKLSMSASRCCCC